MPEEKGKKFDQDPMLKPNIGLVPLRGMWGIAQVMTFGAQKYDSYNWKGGIKYSRLSDAAMRHIIQFVEGEDIDPESGLHHLAHAGCCITMLLEMTMDRPDLDDRYKENVTVPWKVGTGVSCTEISAVKMATQSREAEERINAPKPPEVPEGPPVEYIKEGQIRR